MHGLGFGAGPWGRAGFARSRARRAVGRGGAAAGAVIAALWAAPGASALSTSVVSVSVAEPNAAMTEGDSAVACPGRLVTGGGARMDQSVLSNGVHLVGSFPTPDAIDASASGDASPSAWIAAGGVGGQAASGVSTFAYALCVDGGPAATTVVAAPVSGPAATFTSATSVATCPAGTQLVGGGARTAPGTVGSLKPVGSFPSDAGGAPVLSGSNPSSWAAVGLNGGQGDAGNTTRAFAICATAGPSLTVSVVNARVDGPGPPSTGAQVTATCPAGTVLLGGGGYISDHFGLAGSQGDHLTGMFPSDAGGTPVGSGPASSWTASSHTGGTLSGAMTDTNAWAMCGAGTPASGPGPGGGSPPPPSVAPVSPGTSAGGVTTAQIREAMRLQMIPTGAAAAIGTLLRRDGAKLTFRALDAGHVAIAWSTPPATLPSGRKTKPVLLARGALTFPRSGSRVVAVRLTAAGRRLLRGARRVKVTATGTFIRTGAGTSSTPIVGTKSFVLTPHATAPTP